MRGGGARRSVTAPPFSSIFFSQSRFGMSVASSSSIFTGPVRRGLELVEHVELLAELAACCALDVLHLADDPVELRDLARASRAIRLLRVGERAGARAAQR